MNQLTTGFVRERLFFIISKKSCNYSKQQIYKQLKLNIMENIFLFGLPGGTEIFVILFIVLLLFGGKKIPELMRGIGKGIKEFNNAKATIETEIKEGMKEVDKKELKNE